MGIFDVFVAVVWGIVEGITEWLPISSTGHMILVNQFLSFSDNNFKDMFLVWTNDFVSLVFTQPALR